MAIVTHSLGGFENGLVEFQYDYDDASLVVSVARCINQTSQHAHIWIARQSDGLMVEADMPPGTRAVAIPTSPPANRFRVTVLPNGKLDGLNIELAWPA